MSGAWWEEGVYWNISQQLLTNTSLIIGTSSSWDYPGEYNRTNNKTSNLASYINPYLTASYLVGSNYLIPFIFHSDTAGILQYSDLLFSNEGFTENSQTYTTPTTEGNTESFSLNLTYDSSYYTNILATLIYNGTSYVGTKTGSGNNAIFSKSITAPYVTANVNYSFYWQIGLINSTGTFYYNSTLYNQTVNDLGGIGTCEAYSTTVLNYTMKDERTQLAINSAIWNATIEIDMQVYPVGSNILLMNMSKLYNNTNNAAVCFNATMTNTSQYRLDAQVRYYADGYVTRYNYIQNFTLTNTSIPQNINLFDLQSSQATRFLMTYKDSNFLAVENALINIKRKYVSEGASKVVETSKTDSIGQAIGYFDLTGTIYSVTVTKNGQILSTFDNIAVFCSDILTQNCQLNLDDSAATSSTIDFYTYNNLNWAQTFNSTSRLHSLNFNTIDNTVSLISINLTKFDMYGNTTVCSNQISTSSGTLTCSVPASYGNITFTATIWKDGQIITSTQYTIITPATSAFAGNLVVFSLGILLTLAMMFVPSAIGVIIATFIGIAFAIVLFFISGSLIGSGFFVMIVIVGMLIIWRIRQGNSE